MVFLIAVFVLALILYLFSSIYSFQNLLKTYSVIFVIRFLLLTSLLISFIIHCYVFWCYLHFLSTRLDFLLYTNSPLLWKFNYWRQVDFIYSYSSYFSVELFGLVFIFLGYFVGLISFLALDTRLYWKNIRFIFICNFLVIIINLFASVTDILIFFLLYEALLIPSFLFVYFISPSRRATQASLYFLIWTQIGSFLVLCFVIYVIYLTGNTSFAFFKSFVFTENEIWLLYFCLFFGFGFKVPIWPFHYWLTKTHVEAPTGFSIFLSGFLVKSAIYGFYRLSNVLGGDLETSFFSVFCLLGAIDASLKMWSQTDLKKLVAFATIQEMSLIYLAFCWGDGIAIYGGILFCITHAFLSPLFFYLVDCIQRRYNSRSVVELSGILHTTPNLGIAIIFSVFLYAGLPGTLKFTSELYIFAGLLETGFLSAVIVLYAVNFLGLLSFSKVWFNVVFGLNSKDQALLPVDLTTREILIISLCIFSLFGFNSLLNFFF